MVRWEDFCGCPQSAGCQFNFLPIQNGDLSPCLQLILQGSTSLLLFIFSLGYLVNFRGYKHGRISSTSTLHYVTLLRAWICVFVACSNLARSLIATNEFEGLSDTGSILYYVTLILTAISWLLLGVMFYMARYRFPLYKRGPPIVILIYVLNVAIFAKSFEWYWLLPVGDYRSTIILLYTVAAVSHVFLFTALIPSGIEYSVSSGTNIQDEDERASLVTGTNNVSYRTFGSESVIPRGEDGNILSQLIFWWVQPLMKRGKIGLIQHTEDVFKVSNIPVIPLY